MGPVQKMETGCTAVSWAWAGSEVPLSLDSSKADLKRAWITNPEPLTLFCLCLVTFLHSLLDPHGAHPLCHPGFRHGDPSDATETSLPQKGLS